MAATRRTRLPTRSTINDENAPTTRSRTGTLPPVKAPLARPATTRSVSSTSTIGRKPLSKSVDADIKATTSTTRINGKDEVTRGRAALGELTNHKDVKGPSDKNGKTKPASASSTTSTVTGRPIIARRTTRSSIAAGSIPEGVEAGPSTTVAQPRRPVIKSRASSKTISEEGKPKIASKATSATINNARAGIKRTLTSTNVTQPVARKPSTLDVKAEELVEPSPKRARTSSPAREEQSIKPVDHFKREALTAPPAAIGDLAAETADALEDEQPYEVEEEDVANSGGRHRDAILNIDADDVDDPTMVHEYVQDIFNYMKEIEINTMPNPEYMDQQPHLKWEMRGLLTDWLVEVHHKFRLLPETLFLAVNLVDRFLSARVVSLAKLQLVGLTCLFIAAKYEEVICPTVSNFLFMADGGYTDEEILSAEKYVLTTLDFDLSYPNPMHFLRRVSKAEGYDIQTRTLAKYLMEVSCVDEAFMTFPPSLLAAAGIYVARLVLQRSEWDATLEHYSSCSEEELLPVAQLMINYTLQRGFPHHEAFHRKYSSRKYMKAAPFVRDWAAGKWPAQAAGMAKVGNEMQDLFILNNTPMAPSEPSPALE